MRNIPLEPYIGQNVVYTNYQASGKKIQAEVKLLDTYFYGAFYFAKVEYQGQTFEVLGVHLSVPSKEIPINFTKDGFSVKVDLSLTSSYNRC
jgi:hypothetical protein